LRGTTTMAKCQSCKTPLDGDWKLSKGLLSPAATGRHLGIKNGYFFYHDGPNWVYCYCLSCWKNELSNTDETRLYALIQQKDTLTAEIEAIAQHNTTLEEQTTTLEQQNTALKKQNATLKNQNTTLEQRHTTLQKQNGTLENQNATLEQQKTALGKQKATLEEQKATLEQQKTAFVQQNTVLKRDATALEQKKTALTQEIALLQQQKTTLFRQDIVALEKEKTILTQELSLQRQISSYAQELKDVEVLYGTTGLKKLQQIVQDLSLVEVEVLKELGFESGAMAKKLEEQHKASTKQFVDSTCSDLSAYPCDKQLIVTPIF
jgi:chromosome segregation ATPase